jgi:hypothetical protein
MKTTKMKMSLLLTLPLILVSVTHAAWTNNSEDFEDADFGNAHPVGNSPDWINGGAPDASTPLRTMPGIGYDATRGLGQDNGVPFVPLAVGDATAAVPSTIAAGTVGVKALVNLAALNNSLGNANDLGQIAIGLALSEGSEYGAQNPDNFIEANILGDWSVSPGNTSINLATRNGGIPTEIRPSMGVVAQDLGWFELRVLYNLDANTASVEFQDVSETGPVTFIGATTTLAFLGSPTFTPNFLGVRISNTGVQGGNGGGNGELAPGGIVDNVSYIPEPASMALLGLGGLMMLRRRR